MKELLILNPEEVSEEEVKTWPTREAARAVVLDGDKIALLHVTKKHYYKLPGGGLEGDEDKLVALSRECVEEIGCDVEVVKELGMVIEYRKLFDIRQISYCYLAKVKGDKCQPQFTEREQEDGFEMVWLPFEEAYKTLSSSEPKTPEGMKYIIPRDTVVLETARAYL